MVHRRYRRSCTTTALGMSVLSAPKPWVQGSMNKQRMKAGSKSNGVYQGFNDFRGLTGIRFKLHLRPLSETKGSTITQKLPPLPAGKSVITVYSDFITYLHKCVESYIEQTHPNGVDLWRSLSPQAEYVLSHPNGWEGSQQSQMRKAAVSAGLIPDTTNGNERLHFVTEGEASLHYSLENGLPANSLKVCLITISLCFADICCRKEMALSLWMQVAARLISALMLAVQARPLILKPRRRKYLRKFLLPNVIFMAPFSLVCTLAFLLQVGHFPILM